MQTSKGKSAVKYLTQQLSMNGSAYKMPSPESFQQHWEDWCNKPVDMTSNYDISTETIIHDASRHLPMSDHVTFGWTNCLELMSRDVHVS
jgi:hypothetical protein